MPDPAIGIIGEGVVGGALRAWFDFRGIASVAYDPQKGHRDAAALDRADIVFVCVPTPHDPVHGVDNSALLDAIEVLRTPKTVVIKSTVLPGTTDELQSRYPQHRFIFNPEFLREASAVEDMAHPDRQILGITLFSANEAPRVLDLLPDAPCVRVCAAREAEMAKYMANVFLAVKVSFANEMYELCERIGAGYDVVREIAAADPRIGDSHLNVFDAGYRGYGGKCLPKDSKALLTLAADLGVPLRVLSAADATNDRLTRTPARRPVRSSAGAPPLTSTLAEADRRAA